MPVHVENAINEVIAEPPTGANTESTDSRWQEKDKIRWVMNRKEEIERRTSSYGFED